MTQERFDDLPRSTYILYTSSHVQWQSGRPEGTLRYSNVAIVQLHHSKLMSFKISQRPKAPLFFWCRHFPAAVFSDTNCRMSFIPDLVWTQVLQMHLSSTGGAMPHCSGAHGFLIVLRIQKTWKNVERFSVKPRAIPKIWATYENLWVNMVPSGYD